MHTFHIPGLEMPVTAMKQKLGKPAICCWWTRMALDSGSTLVFPRTECGCCCACVVTSPHHLATLHAAHLSNNSALLPASRLYSFPLQDLSLLNCLPSPTTLIPSSETCNHECTHMRAHSSAATWVPVCRLIQLPEPTADELGRPVWACTPGDVSRAYRK